MTEPKLTERERIARLRMLAGRPADGHDWTIEYWKLAGTGITEAVVPWALRVAFGRDEPPSNWEIRGLGRLVWRDSGIVPRRTLVPWDIALRRPRELRLYLMAWAPDAETHAAVVAEALAAGDVTAEQAAAIGPEGDRPQWIDGEEPWRLGAVRHAGTVRAPDGVLGIGEPVWLFDDFAELSVAPGSYEVALVTAEHPLYPEPGSAALVVTVGDGPVARWERAEPFEFERGHGGLPSVGAPRAMRNVQESVPDEANGIVAAAVTFDVGDLGTMVTPSIVEQFAMIRTWIGRDAEGGLVRVLVDLDLLEGLDPVADPALPWEADG